jgi:hypothetical protein
MLLRFIYVLDNKRIGDVYFEKALISIGIIAAAIIAF